MRPKNKINYQIHWYVAFEKNMTQTPNQPQKNPKKLVNKRDMIKASMKWNEKLRKLVKKMKRRPKK